MKFDNKHIPGDIMVEWRVASNEETHSRMSFNILKYFILFFLS